MTEYGGNINGLQAILVVTHLPALLLLFALGLWHASRRPAGLDLSVALLPAGLAAGFAAHSLGICTPEVLQALLAVLIAVIVAIDSPRLAVFQPPLFTAAGLTIALGSFASLPKNQSVLCVVALSMIPVAVGFYFSLLPQHPVVTIGRRVAGSWILAVSLLIAAFHFKSSGN